MVAMNLDGWRGDDSPRPLGEVPRCFVLILLELEELDEVVVVVADVADKTLVGS